MLINLTVSRYWSSTGTSKYIFRFTAVRLESNEARAIWRATLTGESWHEFGIESSTSRNPPHTFVGKERVTKP